MRPSQWALLTAALVGGCNGASRGLAPVTLEPMVTIGDSEGLGTMATWPRVSPRHFGGFRVLVPQPGGVPAQPLAFADDGHLLGALSVAGDSSGGFGEPLFTRFGPRDSIWVFDNAQRVLVFGPDRHWVRTVPLRVGPWDAAFDREGRILVTSSSSERPFPLLLLDQGGKSVREFAGDSASRLIHSPRRIAAAPDGSWWTLPMQFRYRLEHWDSTGALLGVIERQPDWYPPYADAVGPTREHAPSPMLMNAWFDGAGRLWVLGKVADAQWAAGLSAPVGGDSMPTASITDADKVYDTVIEVLDPATGTLLAQTRFDVSYPFAVEPGVIMRVLATKNGWNRAELMRVVFDSSRVKEGPK